MASGYFLYRMPAAMPGEANRSQTNVILPEVLTPSGTTGHPTAYGIPVIIDAVSGQVRMFTAADDPYLIEGILVRPFPAAASTDGIGTSTPPVDGPCDVMVAGYVGVKLSGTVAAVRNGSVYVWVAAASGTHIVGGFEADPGTVGQTVPLNARFMGPIEANDANKTVEIALNAWPVPASITSRNSVTAKMAGAGSQAVAGIERAVGTSTEAGAGGEAAAGIERAVGTATEAGAGGTSSMAVEAGLGKTTGAGTGGLTVNGTVIGP